MAKIVAVDDDPSIADLIRRALHRAGHEVRTAGDGLSALRLVYEWAPDLVCSTSDWVSSSWLCNWSRC